MQVEPEALADLHIPGGGVHITLGEPVAAYGNEWALVSHTFAIQPGGEGLLSILFERPFQ